MITKMSLVLQAETDNGKVFTNKITANAVGFGFFEDVRVMGELDRIANADASETQLKINENKTSAHLMLEDMKSLKCLPQTDHGYEKNSDGLLKILIDGLVINMTLESIDSSPPMEPDPQKSTPH